LTRPASWNAKSADMSKLGTVAKSSTSISAMSASCGTWASRSSPRCEATVRRSRGSKRDAIVPPVPIRTILRRMTQLLDLRRPGRWPRPAG
jgi:hypothetical protein